MSSPAQGSNVPHDDSSKASGEHSEPGPHHDFINESENESSEGEDAALVFNSRAVNSRIIVDSYGAILDDHKSQEVNDDEDEMDEDEKLFKVDAYIMEDSEEEKVDLEWKRKYLGTLRVEIKTEKDLEKMPDYFRCCRSLRDGLETNLYIDDQSDRQLVNEILKAEKRDLLDVWIKKWARRRRSRRFLLFNAP
eukprot:TRINITY_DN3042_c0_g1_i1.p1 TRINITY_DN3042_c0_g1~~TRINITY_DN3042_c0_g1_i1.p1  ORF type:complete len:193 (-),score=39.45 TRINITY_DN3042_c0_g1_i1:219-797(-)